MSNKVLVVFAGGYDDESLACTFVGMVKHFEKDSHSEVTALSNLNLATFLQRPEGLVFGRMEGKTGRLGVLTGFAHEHRERGYKVIAEAAMKQTIQDWITNAGQGNVNNMTFVFVAHGHPPKALVPAGTIALGSTPLASKLSPEELLLQLDLVPVGIQINLILIPCFSGAFIAQGLETLTRRNVFIHASTSAEDYAWPLRSASYQDRCSLFGAAVVEAISNNPRAGVSEYEATVHTIVQAETQQSTTPHTPQLFVDPNRLWDQPVGSLLGYPVGVVARASRRLYTAAASAVGSFFGRPQPLQLPYGKDADFVKRMCAAIPPLPFPEMPMVSLARKFSEEWATEDQVLHLEEILNFRRSAQSDTVYLFKAWVSQGLININELPLSAGDLTQSSEGTQLNRVLLLKYLPELEALETFYYAAGVYRYYDCTNFLANVIGIGGKAGLTRLLQVANENAGISVSVHPSDIDCELAVPKIQSRGIVGFDLHLPVSTEELNFWKRPEQLELLVAVRESA
jgi:hypothetical protein